MTGSGIASINSGATLEFDAATGNGQTVGFAATTEVLAIGVPSSFAATISGFAPGEKIDLLGVTATAVSYQSSTLTVMDGAGVVASLTLSGSFSNTTDFEVTSDGNGGSLVTIGPPPVIADNVWNSPVSGDWSTAADWNSNAVPNSPSTTAAIAVPGAYTVMIASNESFAIGTLTLSGSSANLNVAGTLDVSNALILEAGTATVAAPGAIVGGTIQTKGGSLTGTGSIREFRDMADGGTLDGVTLQGTLDLSPTLASVIVKDGITMEGSGGAGPGTINLTGANSSPYLQGTETLDNATVNIGTGGVNTATIYDDNRNASSLVTFGANLTINQTGPNAAISTNFLPAGSGFINAGSINAGLNGGLFLIINSLSFTNQGSITVSNGDSLTVFPTTFANSGGGSLNVTSGGTLLMKIERLVECRYNQCERGNARPLRQRRGGTSSGTSLIPAERYRSSTGFSTTRGPL